MNRELRRIQKKADEKKDKEKNKNKQKRMSKIQGKRQRRKDKIVKKSDSKSKQSRFNPDRSKFAVRMAAPFTIFTAFFIGVQVFVPTQESETIPASVGRAIEIAYYLFFGHFLMIWLLKRKVQNAVWYAIAAGVIMTIGLQAAHYFYKSTIDLQVLAFGSLAAVAGAVSGHFFYKDLALVKEKPVLKDESSDGEA